LTHWSQEGISDDLVAYIQFLIWEGPKIIKMSVSTEKEMEALRVLSTNA
jgi:hypothetical protein